MISKNSRLGFVLRRIIWLFSLPRLPKCDESVRIHPMAVFEGFPENVELGKNVIIDAYATIYCHKTGKIKIGDGTYIGNGAIIHTGKKNGSIVIGSNCTVQTYSIVYGHGGCKIGNDVRIATHSVIIPANHRFDDITRPIREQGRTDLGIKIDEDVWMGAGSLILDGVTIGKGCVIGAGSVVNKSLPSGSVAVGSPARPVTNRYAAYNKTCDESE
ncbi:acyltransferase [Oxalobacteraceae bacterium CAVE-383]|nr:acyltransferase [Oxalobacteraceae bacterium CAVE-383]